MSIEVTCLYVAILLGLVQLVLATHFVTRQRGFKWNLSSREDAGPPLVGAAGRLDRAAKNFRETFSFFAAGVLIVQLLGRNSNVSALGAQIYVVARLVYLPVYAAGIQGLRSMIWIGSMIGLAMVLYAVIW